MPEYMNRQSDNERVGGISMKQYRYGALGNVSDNGCGAIALFNIMRHNGRPESFDTIVKTLKRKLGFHCFGLAGTRFGAIRRILEERGFETSFFRPGDASLPDALRAGGDVIVLFHWKEAYVWHYSAGLRGPETESGIFFTFLNSGVCGPGNSVLDGRPVLLTTLFDRLRAMGGKPKRVMIVRRK